MTRSTICGLLLVQALTGALSACGSANDGATERDADSISQVSLSLTALPAGVMCIQVIASAGNTTLANQNFTAASNWTGSVSLGQFTRGTVSVTASAFNVACSALAGAAPSWVADAQSVDVAPGRANPIVLNFRENLALAASSNFAPTIVDFAVGFYSTGLVLADGTVKMFGLVAQPAGTFNGVVELAIGYSHACARKTDGTVWCWGANESGQLGNQVSELADFMMAPNWPQELGRRKHLFHVVSRPFAGDIERLLYRVYGRLIMALRRYPCALRPIDMLLRALRMRWYGYVYLSNRLWISTTS